MPLYQSLLRYRYALVAGISLLVFIGGVGRQTAANDWAFFSWGGRLLFGQHDALVRGGSSFPASSAGGLHIYANYSFLQIGPPALLISRLLDWGPRHGLIVAGLATQALGVIAVLCADRAFRARGSQDLSVLIGGSLLVTVWGSLTHFSHLDDAVTLASLTAGVWALQRHRNVLAGALLGICAATKPWGVVVLALALSIPGWRSRARVGLVAVCTALLCWGPFILADADTLRLGEVQLPLSPRSALAALGVQHINNPQSLRAAQFGVGLALAAAICLRGAWPAAALGAFAVRLLLEPSAYQYYDVALVLAALLADLGLLRLKVPVLTILTVAAWSATQAMPDAAVAVLHLIEYAAVTLSALLMSWDRVATAATRSRRCPQESLLR